jgi:hypothetical protein
MGHLNSFTKLILTLLYKLFVVESSLNESQGRIPFDVSYLILYIVVDFLAFKAQTFQKSANQ